MPSYDRIKQAAFYDEMQKIAGSLQGFTRIGRRPISAEKFLSKGSKKLADIVKVSAPVKPLMYVAGGALGLHQAQKVKRRYDLGKQVEMQQG